MASFTVNVDTSSLAEHIDDISRSVQDVGSAVDDMSNRLVSAEQVAAQTVSDNVTYGFYMLTRNQFTQKAVELENDVRMTFIKVQAYADDLREIQSRMEKDYNLISRQYIKIFNSIDDSLRTAVKELDQSVIEVAYTGRQKLSERRTDGSLKAVSYPSDLIPASQSMISGKLKAKGRQLIRRIFSYISAEKELSSKMHGVLSPEKAEEGTTVFFPVVLMESDGLDSDSSSMEIHMPNFPSELASESGSIFSRVIDLKNEEGLWKEGRSDQKQLVRQCFSALSSGLDERKRRIMSELLEASAWKEMKDQ